MMAPLISNTTPLASNGTWASLVQSLTRATQIVGSVFTDVSGTVAIQQSGDGINFDTVQNYTVNANTGLAIEVPVINQYFRVVYTNGTTAQTVFRLFISIMDPYGAFLTQALAPSPGGAYLVLFLDSTGYQIIGRYDANDGLSANTNAAINSGRSGQYASFLVTDATVSIESIIKTTEHSPASF